MAIQQISDSERARRSQLVQDLFVVAGATLVGCIAAVATAKYGFGLNVSQTVDWGIDGVSTGGALASLYISSRTILRAMTCG